MIKELKEFLVSVWSEREKFYKKAKLNKLLKKRMTIQIEMDDLSQEIFNLQDKEVLMAELGLDKILENDTKDKMLKLAGIK